LWCGAQHAKDPQEAAAFLRLLEIESTDLDAPSAVSAHINTAAGFVKSEFLRDDYLTLQRFILWIPCISYFMNTQLLVSQRFNSARMVETSYSEQPWLFMKIF